MATLDEAAAVSRKVSILRGLLTGTLEVLHSMIFIIGTWYVFNAMQITFLFIGTALALLDRQVLVSLFR